MLHTALVDYIYMPDGPESQPPDYCVVGPSTCQEIVAISGSFELLYDFVDAVQNGTYVSWMNNSDNYAFLLDMSPDYEDLFEEVKLGNKFMEYYEYSSENIEAAILMG